LESQAKNIRVIGVKSLILNGDIFASSYCRGKLLIEPWKFKIKDLTPFFIDLDLRRKPFIEGCV